MTADPKQLLAAPLKRAGIPDAEILATEQLALLRGNHLLAEDGTTPRRMKPAPETRRCAAPDDPRTGTALVGGRCPICGWTP